MISITIKGPQGSGKTSIATALANLLEDSKKLQSIVNNDAIVLAEAIEEGALALENKYAATDHVVILTIQN